LRCRRHISDPVGRHDDYTVVITDDEVPAAGHHSSAGHGLADLALPPLVGTSRARSASEDRKAAFADRGAVADDPVDHDTR
jgi:hypothetical protein